MSSWFIKSVAAGANTGLSEADAWQSWADVVWGAGGVVGGDFLEVVDDGTHRITSYVTALGGARAAIHPTASGSAGAYITIRALSGRPKITPLSLIAFPAGWTGPDGNGEYATVATHTGSRWQVLGDGVRLVGQPSEDLNGYTNMPVAGLLAEMEWAHNDADDKIYFKPAAGNDPGDYVMEIGSNSTDIHVIALDNRDFIRVKGLEIYGGIRGFGIRMDTCQSSIINDNIVHSSHACIWSDSGDNPIITNNVAYDADRRGIGDGGFDPASGTTNQIVQGNEIYNIGNLSSDRYDQEANMTGPGGSALIEYNYIHDIGTNGLIDTGGPKDGLNSGAIQGDDADITVRYNLIKNVGGYGILLSCKNATTRTCVAHSNIIIDAGMNLRANRVPIMLRALAQDIQWGFNYAGHGDFYVYNNTIKGGKTNLASVDGAITMRTAAADIDDGPESDGIINCHIYNNTIEDVDCDWEMYVFEGAPLTTATSKVNLVRCDHNQWSPLSGGSSNGIKFNLQQAMGTQNGRVIDTSGSPWAAADIVGIVSEKFTFDANYEVAGAPTSIQGDPEFILGADLDKLAESVYPTTDGPGYLKGDSNSVDDYHDYPFKSPATIGAVEFKTGDVFGALSGAYLTSFDQASSWVA